MILRFLCYKSNNIFEYHENGAKCFPLLFFSQVIIIATITV